MALAESAPSRPNRHHARLKVGIRIAVTAGLFAILVTKIHYDDFVPRHHTAGTWAFLAAGILLMALSFVLCAFRWQQVIKVFGYDVLLRTLTKHYLAGQYVGNLLPSTIGGDVLRVSRSSAEIGSTSDAFAAVVFERLTGSLVLPLLVFAGFALHPELFDVDRSGVALLIATGALSLLGLVLFLAGHPKVAGRFAGHDNWMRAIGAVHEGVHHFRRHPRRAAIVLGASLVYQLVVVSSVYCAFHVVDVRVANGVILAYVPAVSLAQGMPITVGGLGIREGLLAFLLHPLGVSTGRAVAIGLLWYGMTLLVSVLGAPSFAVGARKQTSDAEPAADAEHAAASDGS